MDKILTWLTVLTLLILSNSTALAQTDTDPNHRTEPKILTVDRADDPPHTPLRRCWDKTPADCTLRDAILRANQDAGQSYRIILPAGSYTLAIPGEEGLNQAGDLDLQGEIELVGAGSQSTIISAGRIDRVMQVLSGARVKLSGLTLRDGQASPTNPGGGLWNAGLLEMTDMVVTENCAGDGIPYEVDPNERWDGAAGGGIFNQGSLHIENSQITHNQAGKGVKNSRYVDGNSQPIEGGKGGNGGGIFNLGEMEVFSSTIRSNRAGTGGAGSGNFDPQDYSCDADVPSEGGDGGNGGGIANQQYMELVGVGVLENVAGTGGVGGCGDYIGGRGGDGGTGGGIDNRGTLHISNSRIGENQSGIYGLGGVGCYYENGKEGSPGAGGGLSNTGFTELLDGSCEHNWTAPMTFTVNWPNIIHYFTGPGGCIYNADAGQINIKNLYVQDNQASGFGGGIANEGNLEITAGEIQRNSSRMGGGGISNGGYLAVSQTTLANNTTGPGYAGEQVCSKYSGTVPTDGLSPDGGGFFNQGNAKLNAIVILNNATGDGGPGGRGDCGFPGSSLGDGASGGRGGGIFNLGELEMNLAVVADNQTGKGGQAGTGSGNYTPGLNGPGGSGGGIYNLGQLSGSYVRLQGNNTGAGFSANEPGGSGGGIANATQTGIENLFELHDSLVLGNSTADGGMGGGLLLSSAPTEPSAVLLSSTRVLSNTAQTNGGGIAAVGTPLKLENLIVASNHITETARGAGIFIQGAQTIMNPPSASLSKAQHLTIAGNQGGNGSGLYDQWLPLTLTDTIIAGQPVGVVVTGTTPLTMTNTLWGRGSYANGTDWLSSGTLLTGTLNLFADPLFVDPENLDFHLQALSPARDMGVDRQPPLDVDAQPRPDWSGRLPDIGADELWFLVPVHAASISAPQVITATLPVAFAVSLDPPDATPQVRCFWMPEPAFGQWSCNPTFVFPQQGQQTVEVWVLQGGIDPLRLQIEVTVQPLWRSLFLPVVKK